MDNTKAGSLLCADGLKVAAMPDAQNLALASLPARPYPGLRPFEKEEWAIFFGREQMIEEVIARLAEHRFVLVHGGSGSGKSSLIRAGVLACLEREYARHGLSWRTSAMRPGGSPLWNFAVALAQLDDRVPSEEPPLESVLTTRRILNRGVDAAGGLATLPSLARDSNVCSNFCILVDQFEELFRFAREKSKDEAHIFIDVLRGFAEAPPEGVHVVLTMRSDHLGECGEYVGFAEVLNRTQYLLPRMEERALIRAIREPARLYGGEVEIDLAMRLVRDSANEADALPLIQHALMRLWLEAVQACASRPRVSQIDYKGLRTLLSEHADEILAELKAQDIVPPRVIELVFRALTDVDAHGRFIRRPQTLEQLQKVTGASADTLRAMIYRYRGADCGFLTPYTGVPLADSDVIDIGHEALIRCWSTMNKEETGWLQREIKDGQMWRALLLQVETFRADRSALLSSSVLSDRQKRLTDLNKSWAERYGDQWDDVKELIRKSKAQITRKNSRRLFIRLFGFSYVPILFLWYVHEQESGWLYFDLLSAAIATVFYAMVLFVIIYLIRTLFRPVYRLLSRQRA